MNTDVTQNVKFWSFILVAIISLVITLLVIILKVEKGQRLIAPDAERGSLTHAEEGVIGRGLSKILNWIREYRLVMHTEGIFKPAAVVTGDLKKAE